MKLQLSQHISRLLFEHECVIVPDYGAFLTRYHHAEVNPATHMMRPPSRRVYLNTGLKANDGLLAKSISLSENCSYKQALTWIEEEVNTWKSEVGKGEKLALPGIGRLFLDDQGKLQFSPSLENNFHRSSYGLSIFRSPAIEREAQIRTVIQKTIEKHVPPVVAPPELTEKAKSRRIPWAAVLGPVIFAGILGAAYVGYQNRPLESMSGLNWIEMSRSSAIQSDITAPEPSFGVEDEAVTENTLDEPIASEPNKVEEAITEIPVSQIYPYHIVVGSFKEVTNAEAYVEQLQAKGYEAYMANGDRRFKRVAVGNFATKAQAETALSGIRGSLNSQAWIYSN